jgi:hypothetical protein
MSPCFMANDAAPMSAPVPIARLIDRHVADPTTPSPSPVQTSPVDLIDRLKPDFEKRPTAPSLRRKAIPAAGRKRS